MQIVSNDYSIASTEHDSHLTLFLLIRSHLFRYRHIHALSGPSSEYVLTVYVIKFARKDEKEEKGEREEKGMNMVVKGTTMQC